MVDACVVVAVRVDILVVVGEVVVVVGEVVSFGTVVVGA